MEEDSGVKAPVTRLRRRLSVEQSEESKSPAPNTPTKARRGRRKPELELIEENSTTKTPLKTVAKDIVEEEKPLTPSRRSVRIRSNTSIVSETAVVDSPRAKRAARRLSQVGSDTEGPTTPARQTRRTRKDSTSSIEKAETQVAAKQNTIPEPISEENEANNQLPVSPSTDEKPVRKSPRLQEKKGRKSKTSESPDKTNNDDFNKSLISSDVETKKNESTEASVNQASETNEVTIQSPVKKSGKLSIGSTELLENISAKSTKKMSSLNKSTSSLINSITESKRSRTKSCTVSTLSATANDNMFHSDNESTNKRRKSSNSRTPLKQLNISGSNKSLNKSTNKESSFTESPKNATIQKEKSGLGNDNSADLQNIYKQNLSSNMKVTITFEDSDSNPERLNKAEDDQCVPEINHINENPNKLDTFSNTEKDNITAENNQINETCEPMDVDETIPDHLLIDHSQIENKSMHSPQKSKRKSSIEQNIDNVESHNKSNLYGLSDQKNISSCEANISKQNTSTQSAKGSKRQSSISQSFNESDNQNKSTLVLSHLKDISESEVNKSSNHQRLSNSSTVLNITQENIVTNKNLSLCYSTSTPLQQKGSRGVNVNTSNIKSSGENKLLVSKTKDSDSESDSSESETKGNLSKSTKQKLDSSEDSNDDDDSPHEKSNLMDDEAEDAGDDYESGDSQDEEEREEALANEIREKGETLTSDEEFSDDSDYEKDSFVVSSAEEDNELLDGSENDLSMSDNELNMSKKSKQKFNERKLKEQKQVSREMFESRHQINNSKTEKKKKRTQINSSSESESDNEVKKPLKPKTRQILDSSADTTSKSQRNSSTKKELQSTSSSESDYEVSKPFKAKNKQRLDSVDMNISKDDNTKIPKRNKTPSQSICNESIVDNEKEMSINIDQVANECDPLSQSIKKEPNTPLKENMSLAFIDAQNNTNVSFKEGDKLDPLAATVANDDDDDDSSMSSDNERIVEDYDSILQGLNKANKIKSVDTSLNFEKKTKKKDKDPIVDQLNLTQVKGKKSKNKLEVTKKEKSKETKVLQAVDDESSSASESALMNLLFSEESNHCDDANTKNADDNNYISLKRVAGKTDIRDSGDSKQQENEESNKTPKDKKNKNRTISETSVTKELDADYSPMNKSLKTPKSDKKKKQKKISESQATEINSEDGSIKFFIDTEGSSAQNDSMGEKPLRDKTSETEKDNDSDSEPPMEVSFKKNKNLSTSKLDDVDEMSSNLSSNIGSGKKKKKQSMDNTTIEIKVTTESSKKKSKKISISFNESITTDEKGSIESTNTLNVGTPECGKKTRKNSNTKDEIDAAELSINKSVLKTPSSDKKKKNKLNEVVASEETNSIESTKTLNVNTPGSGKKTRKNSNTKDEIDAAELSINKSILKTPSSDKKNKKSKEFVPSEETYTEITPILATPGSAKKTQKNETGNDNDPEGESNKLSKAQKRKRKISSLVSEEEQKDHIEKETFNSNKQKKVKLTPQNMTEENVTESLKGTKNKKRKEREDDNIETASQALKETSFKKLQVSRLPTSILEQLDEKPRHEEPKRKKSKLIATTDFIVEETKIRRNKPSMYLEESIYLNDDEKELKKQKAKNVKPKVLPFVPTASTSISGYTTNFKVNITPRDTKFVAQSNNVTNFKSEYLYGKKIKRNGTYEMYKKSRNVKMSKF